MTGTAGRASVTLILRDFDDERLAAHGELLRDTVAAVAQRHPGATVEVDFVEQYRNMRVHLDRVPHVTAAAETAIEAEGLPVVRAPIRGGTDGSILTERGLPTPNLFTGGHEFHSAREWASLQEMSAAAATLVHLAEVWADSAVSSVAELAR
jgi:tripeptide aminopeptidase